MTPKSTAALEITYFLLYSMWKTVCQESVSEFIVFGEKY